LDAVFERFDDEPAASAGRSAAVYRV